MTIRVVYPLAIAIAIAGMLSGATAGISIFSGTSTPTALNRGGLVFLISLCVFGIGLLLFLLWDWRDRDILLAEIHSGRTGPMPKPERDRVPIPVRTGGLPPRQSARDKLQRAIEQRQQQGRQSRERQMGKVPTFAQTTQRVRAQPQPERAVVAPVQPRDEMRAAYKELYQMTHLFYSIAPTRENFEDQFPGQNGQQMYLDWREKWMRLGWVELDGRGTPHFIHDEADLYLRDRNLHLVAQEMSFPFPGRGAS